MVSKNPFVVLGLNADILRGMDDNQIRMLVKSQYRALQLIYHPDQKTGNEAKSIALNEAYSLLEKPEVYELFKDKFLQTRRTGKQTGLEASVQQANLRADGFCRQFVDYLSKMDDENSVFNLAPCRMQIYDAVHGMNLSTVRKTILGKNSNLFYEFELMRGGRVLKNKNNRIKELWEKILIGAVPEETAKQHGGIKNVLRMAQPIFTQEDISIRNRMRLRGRVIEEESYAKERIAPDSFQAIAPMITPIVDEGSYLFSFNQDAQGDYFALDGGVVKIIR